MKIKIGNRYIEATINSLGAELTSLKLKSDGTEYLWQADPQYWGRHAPILFPIVGKLLGNTYTYQGKSYSLPQHGFARDNEFELLESTSGSATYVTQSSSETISKYPFPYQLEVKYTLENNALGISYTVKNTGTDEMYFSIGAHPGFNCPLLQSESMEDYYIEFEHNETTDTYVIENALISLDKKPLLNNEKIIPLSKKLFENDALILEDIKSKKISIKNKSGSKSITMEFPGFPLFGIWSKPEGAPFVCLEPWYGIADIEGHNGDFTKKKGIQRLSSGQTFVCSYKIIIE